MTIVNIGKGPARNVTVTSLQPEIVENLPGNPLPDAFEVAAHDGANVKAVSRNLRTPALPPGVEKVNDGEEVSDRVVTVARVLSTAFALLVSGTAFLVHEQNSWFFARSAFLHHLIGWTLVVAALFPLGAAFRPRKPIWAVGFAATWVAVAVMLFSDRDVAPIFGHLSDFARAPSG